MFGEGAYCGCQVHYCPLDVFLVSEVCPNDIRIVGDEDLLINKALLHDLLVVESERP